MSANVAITAAGKLLSDKSRWTVGALARTKKGKECDPTRGHSFCAIGAIYYVTGSALMDPNRHASAALCHLISAANQLFKRCPEWVNDNLTHADVMEMMRRAYVISKEN